MSEDMELYYEALSMLKIAQVQIEEMVEKLSAVLHGPD